MKKLILLIAIMASAFSAWAQDSLCINKKDGTVISYAISAVDSISFKKAIVVTEYVLINGVKWATKNVNTPGTFTTKPEDVGMFYQWNSKVGWPATGAIGSITATNGATTWNSSWNGGFAAASASDTWSSAYDPSPAGYRIPTSAEQQTLFDQAKVTRIWTTVNSVYGEKFTDIATGNSIFFPASGCRDDNAGGALSGAGSGGGCWSSTASNASYAYALGFDNSGADWDSVNRAAGFTVRPVAE